MAADGAPVLTRVALAAITPHPSDRPRRPDRMTLPEAAALPSPRHLPEAALPFDVSDIVGVIVEDGTAQLLQAPAVRPLEGPVGHEYAFGGIWGERRLWASLLAGATHVWAVVLDVDTEEAAVLHVRENAAHAPLPPLAEALELGRLRDAHGLTPATIAARVGKGEADVRRAFLILAAIPAAQAALVACAVTPDVVAFFGRHPLPLQEEAWSTLAAMLVGREQAMALTRTVRLLFARLPLSAAPWPLGAWAQLVDAEGDASAPEQLPACVGCPKRSDAQTALLGLDVGSGAYCLDRACYEQKETAWARHERDAEEDAPESAAPSRPATRAPSVETGRNPAGSLGSGEGAPKASRPLPQAKLPTGPGPADTAREDREIKRRIQQRALQLVGKTFTKWKPDEKFWRLLASLVVRHVAAVDSNVLRDMLERRGLADVADSRKRMLVETGAASEGECRGMIVELLAGAGVDNADDEDDVYASATRAAKIDLEALREQVRPKALTQAERLVATKEAGGATRLACDCRPVPRKGSCKATCASKRPAKSGRPTPPAGVPAIWRGSCEDPERVMCSWCGATRRDPKLGGNAAIKDGEAGGVDNCPRCPIMRPSAEAKLVPTETPDLASEAGTCAVCRCQDASPCEGGCSWMDDTETLCSRCGELREAIEEHIHASPSDPTLASILDQLDEQFSEEAWWSPLRASDALAVFTKQGALVLANGRYTLPMTAPSAETPKGEPTAPATGRDLTTKADTAHLERDEWAIAKTRACPSCSAEPGQGCLSGKGKLGTGWVHGLRVSPAPEPEKPDDDACPLTWLQVQDLAKRLKIKGIHEGANSPENVWGCVKRIRAEHMPAPGVLTTRKTLRQALESSGSSSVDLAIGWLVDAGELVSRGGDGVNQRFGRGESTEGATRQTEGATRQTEIPGSGPLASVIDGALERNILAACKVPRTEKQAHAASKPYSRAQFDAAVVVLIAAEKLGRKAGKLIAADD